MGWVIAAMGVIDMIATKAIDTVRVMDDASLAEYTHGLVFFFSHAGWYGVLAFGLLDCWMDGSVG